MVKALGVVKLRSPQPRLLTYLERKACSALHSKPSRSSVT